MNGVEYVDDLAADLMKMVVEDDLYWLRNDAKIRAAEQTSNYQEFSNLVKEWQQRRQREKEVERVSSRN